MPAASITNAIPQTSLFRFRAFILGREMPAGKAANTGDFPAGVYDQQSLTPFPLS